LFSITRCSHIDRAYCADFSHFNDIGRTSIKGEGDYFFFGKGFDGELARDANDKCLTYDVAVCDFESASY
jgi:hypothetical protein